MNQTDKNIALAKECGAWMNTDTGVQSLLDGSIAFTTSELDEYTSRVCAEKQSQCEKLSEGIINLLNINENIHGAARIAKQEIEKKDALIAMQADALEQLMNVERRDRIMPIGKEWDAARQAIAATAETVEAWKDKLVNEEVAKALEDAATRANSMYGYEPAAGQLLRSIANERRNRK